MSNPSRTPASGAHAAPNPAPGSYAAPALAPACQTSAHQAVNLSPGLAPNLSPDVVLIRRQERFCREFVIRANAADAARVAGYARRTANNQGYRLLCRPAIRARIVQMQAQLARDHALGRDVLLGKLEVVYRRAIGAHHFHAAARAVEIQARLGGISGGVPPNKVEGLSGGVPPDQNGGLSGGASANRQDGVTDTVPPPEMTTPEMTTNDDK